MTEGDAGLAFRIVKEKESSGRLKVAVMPKVSKQAPLRRSFSFGQIRDARASRSFGNPRALATSGRKPALRPYEVLFTILPQ